MTTGTQRAQTTFSKPPKTQDVLLTQEQLVFLPPTPFLKAQEILDPFKRIQRMLEPLHASAKALECSSSGGLERFPVFKKLKSKSAVIFFKYILLNKTSILDASSKLWSMFKMT